MRMTAWHYYNGTQGFAGLREDGTLLTSTQGTLASDIAGQRRRAYAQWQEKMEQQRLALLAAEEEEEAFDPYAKLREELQQRIDAIHREMDSLKGIFAAKRRKELEEKMGWLLLELDKLPRRKEE